MGLLGILVALGLTLEHPFGAYMSAMGSEADTALLKSVLFLERVLAFHSAATDPDAGFLCLAAAVCVFSLSTAFRTRSGRAWCVM